VEAQGSSPRVSPGSRTGEAPSLPLAAELLAELAPRLYRLLRTALDEERGSPSLEQLRVMHRISQGLHNVSALAAARQMRISAVTAILDVLAERGWIIRLPDETDRRRMHIDLTASGRVVLHRGRALTTRRMAVVLEGYEGDGGELTRVLGELTGAVMDYDDSRARRSLPGTGT
jgi:DNA-binding MarR family transcriptional regulator